MPGPETLRWLIGGGLSALGLILLGVLYIVRFAWRAGSTFTGITDKLAYHEKLHDQHVANYAAHDERIRDAETALARHSGQMKVV